MEKTLSKRESNKTQKKAALVDAAEKLFVQKGFENTSIDDVARDAGLTKRTLYQYFISKEDLFFAVALRGAKQLTSMYEEALGRGVTALEKIRLANQAYLRFYQQNTGMFKLLNYQPANQQNSLASPHYVEMGRVIGTRMGHFAGLVDLARADGSIDPRLDLKQAVYFAFFSAFSLLYASSVQDKSGWAIMGLDEYDFLRFGFELLSDALK